MSLSRDALDKWFKCAKEDLASAPADGMLVYLINQISPMDEPKEITRTDVEIIAVAYAKALQQYTRM